MALSPVEARRTPGQPDMWAFVGFEALVFSSYFVVYMLRRMQAPAQFLAAQRHLSPGWGVLNTLVLLASSWLMARAVQCARERDYAAALRQVWLTIACGAVFVVLKLLEWAHALGQGYGFGSAEFFSFYYFLTGIHVLHVLIGLVVLGVAVYQLRGPLRRSQEVVETCATYWHMVDFLWALIFALLYVMR
jgi:nitric oxide reductase NorE protein